MDQTFSARIVRSTQKDGFVVTISVVGYVDMKTWINGGTFFLVFLPGALVRLKGHTSQEPPVISTIAGNSIHS